jgi:hypothetical protein
MSCESNPEVISTPMQQAKRQKYIFRRLGFLYHLTGSSAAICVTIGSENPDALGTGTGIWMCGAIVKTRTSFEGLARDFVKEFCSWFCDDFQEEEVEETIYIYFHLRYWTAILMWGRSSPRRLVAFCLISG